MSSFLLLAQCPQVCIGQDSAPAQSTHNSNSYWSRFALGLGTSIFAHETAHLLTSLAVGAHPHLGFDKGRPTIYSGIDTERDPHKQFLFSASGLTAQGLINELVLDIPHSRGSALERGILAGGIATTLFYITIGRNGAVSDVAFMSRTSSLSKNQISAIFGGVSAIQAWRISRNQRYDHFFIHPHEGGLALGLSY